jgi:tricorn protease-like protein
MFLKEGENTKILKFDTKTELLEFLNKRELRSTNRNFVVMYSYDSKLSCWICKLTRTEVYIQELREQGVLKD